jgi:hypothetical protein
VDWVANGTETDLDCGGSCAPCADLKACGVAADCKSGICDAKVCKAGSCADTVKNGSETDVDCGGTCGACEAGKACGVAADCKSGVCGGGLCKASGSSCTDGLKNGTETDKDCGGSCAPCADGKTCTAAADCASTVCVATTCKAPSCSDGVKNGNETSVDCGGGCPPRATKTVALVGNLDAAAAIAPAWDSTQPGTTSNHSTQVTIYDSTGASHVLTIYFRRAGSGAWEWHALVDGKGIQGGVPGTRVEIASGTAIFDANGALTGASGVANFNPVGAAQPQSLLFDFGDPKGLGGTGIVGLTQKTAAFAITKASQDGCK